MSQNEKVFQMADMAPSGQKLNHNGQSNGNQTERNFASLDNNQEFDPEKFVRNQPQNVETGASNNQFSANDPSFREENTKVQEGPGNNQDTKQFK